MTPTTTTRGKPATAQTSVVLFFEGEAETPRSHSVTCRGCNHAFSHKRKLKAHQAGYEHLSSEEMLSQRPRCQNLVRYAAMGPAKKRRRQDYDEQRASSDDLAQARPLRRLRPRKKLAVAEIGDIRAALAQPAGSLDPAGLPVALLRKSRFQNEREGVSGRALDDAKQWLRGIPGVAAFLRLSEVNSAAVESHLVLVAYSARACQCIQPATNTLCIAVGDDVAHIEDVEAFRNVFNASMSAGLSDAEATLWMLIAHAVAQPHVLNELAKVIAKEGLAPTQANMKDAFFKRLKAKVGSSGQDVFGVDSV